MAVALRPLHEIALGRYLGGRSALASAVAMAFDARSLFVALPPLDARVIRVDLATGAETVVVGARPEHAIKSLAVNADGARFAIGFGEWGGAQLFDASSGQRLVAVDESEMFVQAVAFRGEHLVYARASGNGAGFASAATGEIVQRCGDGPGCETALSPRGKLLARVRRDQNEVEVSHALRSDPKLLLRIGLPSAVKHLAFSADESALAAVDRATNVVVASTRDGSRRAAFKLAESTRTWAWASAVVALTPQGELCLAGHVAQDGSGELGIWDVASGQQVHAHRPGKATKLAVEVSPDGRHVALCEDERVRLFALLRN